MNINEAGAQLSLAVSSLRHLGGDRRADALASRIGDIKAELSSGDYSTASSRLETIRTELATLTAVPRAKSELLPGVQTAMGRISAALKALNGHGA
jgi:hypothetical protein